MLKIVLIALIAFVAVPGTGTATAAPDPVPSRDVPRVRPHDARSATLLLEGMARSATMRHIVDRLEESDVIVYITMQPGLNRQLSGRLVWVTAVKNFRYVRISLNPELSGETGIAVLGHELQHALEVGGAPSIVSEATLEDYYRQHGINMRTHTSGWDTQAARDTGDLVRRELAGAPQRTAESIAAFDPAAWDAVYRRARNRPGR